jgi:hemolysin activation/secretion protein
VRSVEVLGSTVFDDEDLDAITREFTDRRLTTADLVALTQAITRLYVDAGYVTSGAVLPDQDPALGLVIIHIIEGSVDEIVIEGAEYFRESYLRARLELAAKTPLNVERLTNQLAVLQRDTRIQRVQATLDPTDARGVSRLRLVVEENSPWSLSFVASNDRPNSIGSIGGGGDAGRSNIFGLGEDLSIAARFSEGLRQVRVEGRIPISAYDTDLRASYQWSRAEVVDSSFRTLDIETESETVRIELHQPVIRNRYHEFSLGVIGSWTRSRSQLLGRTFCFQAAVLDCRPTVSAIRLQQDYLWRRRSTVVSARSTLSFGLGIIDATKERSNGTPDGEFVSWLAQLRWLQRMSTEIPALEWLTGSIFVLRGDLQLSNEPLLTTEQISVGGPRTVRAFRRNRLVRDNAVIGSVELRVPVWKRAFEEPIVELTPFLDFGHAWNDRGPNPVNTLSSIGLALRLDLGNGVVANASWGHRIRRGLDEADGLQRDGIYFEVTWNAL